MRDAGDAGHVGDRVGQRRVHVLRLPIGGDGVLFTSGGEGQDDGQRARLPRADLKIDLKRCQDVSLGARLVAERRDMEHVVDAAEVVAGVVRRDRGGADTAEDPHGRGLGAIGGDEPLQVRVVARHDILSQRAAQTTEA